MRILRIGMVVLTAGQLALASGQTFDRRYDLFQQHLAQVAFDIERLGDGSIAVVANTYFVDTPYQYSTAALLGLSDDGGPLYTSKMLDGMSSIYAGFANCASVVHDGGCAIAGSTFPPSEIQNAALIRYANNGDSLWLREYGDLVYSWIARGIHQTRDSGFVLLGETEAVGNIDAFLIKTDSAGNEQWRKTYGGPDYWDFAVSIDTTIDDGYFVGGESQNSPTDEQLWVMRLNAQGDTLWTTKWGTPYDEPNAHLSTLANGNPIIASAWGFAPAFGLTQAYMAELDQTDGHILWEHWYGPIVNLTTLWTPKEVAPGAGCIASGFDFAENSNFFRGLLLRTAANGDSLWMRSYFYYDSLMTDGMGEFKDVIPTDDHGFIACGYTNGAYTGPYPPQYSQDVWVVKVDSLGCIVPGCDIITGIHEQITNLKDALAVYPNPVRGVLHVKIKLPSHFNTEGPLMLTMTSLDGKLVRQQQVPTSATDEVTVDVSALASGTYALHLSDAQRWIAGKTFVVE